MTAPNVSITVTNGNLGNAAPSPSSTIAVVGCSSSGTANVVSGPYSNIATLIANYGYGPGVEAAAALIAAGSQPLFIKTASTTPGSSSAVVKTGTAGLSVMTVTVGAAYDRYNAIITIVRAGTVGSGIPGGFTYSLDGGLTTSVEIRMPVSGDYVIPNTGLTIHFTVATIGVGDTYTFTTTAPAWANGDLTTAAAALKVSTKIAGLMHVVGPMNATAAGVLHTALAAFPASKKFIRALVESVDFTTDEATWMTTIQTDFALFTSDFISVAAAPLLYPSAINGIQFRRSCAFPAIVRLSQVAISQSAGEVGLGALPSVTTVYHDELAVPGLDSDRFLTMTSIPGLTGYYITRPLLMYGVGSDFTEIQYGRVMDEACRITYSFFVQRLNSRVRLTPSTGLILEKDARALETGCDTALMSGLVNTGDASAEECVVSRADLISSTKTLTVTVRILPVGYIEYVVATIGFTTSIA
jgi:hypothetical protein